MAAYTVPAITRIRLDSEIKIDTIGHFTRRIFFGRSSMT